MNIRYDISFCHPRIFPSRTFPRPKNRFAMNRSDLLKGVSVFDGKARLSVSKDLLEAALFPLDGHLELDWVPQLPGVLAGHGIVSGLLPAPREDGKKWVLAKGKEPVSGEDARIIYEIPLRKDRPGEESPEPLMIDLRDRGVIVNVKKGEVIARKTRPGPGIPGINVFGEEIAPKPGAWIPFPSGPGTEISKDDELLLAIHPGALVKRGGVISVLEEFEIPGPVDISVGNISFVGKRLIVKGFIGTGSEVETAGDLVVKGDVEDEVRIKAGGDMDVTGIIRSENTRVIVSGNLSCSAVEYANIEVHGDLQVRDYILNAVCTVSGSVHVAGGRGLIAGGSVSAGGSIIANVIGTQANVPTEVSAGNDKWAMEQIIYLTKKREGLAKKIEDIRGGLMKLKEIEAQGPLDTRAIIIKERLEEAAVAIAGEIYQHNEAIETLSSRMLDRERAVVRAMDMIHPNVSVSVCEAFIRLQDSLGGTEFSYQRGAIGVKPLSSP